MHHIKISFVALIVFTLIYSCNKNITPKIIEEHDPIVKILEERDSIRIIPIDTTKVEQQKHNKK